MTKTVKKEAKTVDEAVRLALEELGVPAERAMVEVIEEGKGGILGFGAKNALVEVSWEETLEDQILTFIQPILDGMDISPEITITEEPGQVSVIMQGEHCGIAIGRRGETLDALQYLTSLVINKGSDTYTRVLMDVSDYRVKREETLVRLAKRVAEKVQRSHRNLTLEPMNPYERRIIHSALQGFKDIETHSVGEEPNRKVVVRSTRSAPAQEVPTTATERNKVPFGSRAPGYGSPSPQQNPNSYRNRSTERIGYQGNPTASGSASVPQPVPNAEGTRPWDIEDEETSES